LFAGTPADVTTAVCPNGITTIGNNGGASAILSFGNYWSTITSPFGLVTGNPSNAINEMGDTYTNTSGVDATIAGPVVGNINTQCKATIASVAGVGTFTNGCVTTASLCSAKDLTTPATIPVVAAPTAGSVSYSGATGTDSVTIGCI
jgi:hypothetical protein